MTTKKIIITGTHHTPAIELIRQLKHDKKTQWQIYYITHTYKTETHIKNTIKPILKNNLIQIDCGKYDRNSIKNTFAGLLKTISAIKTSATILTQIQPDIVVSFGGYVSVPVIISAWLKKIPSITHEQTTTQSLSTKINSIFVNQVALSFPLQTTTTKQIVTGNLIRQEVFSTKTQNYKKLADTIKQKPLIFVSGGNQGSSIINKTFVKLAKRLSSQFTVIHHTGNLDYTWIKKQTQQIANYHVTKYIGAGDIGWILNKSHIIINRSGANYCQEIVALKKNSILIPLPFSQQNEQLKLANWVKQQLPDHTIIINQTDLTTSGLKTAIEKLNSAPPLPTIKSIPVQNNQILNLIHKYV